MTCVVDEEVDGGVEAGEERAEADEDVGHAAHHARVALRGRGAPQLLVQVGHHLQPKGSAGHDSQTDAYSLNCSIVF